MKTSEKTKKLKKKYKALTFLSWFSCFGITALLLIIMLAGKEDGTPLRVLLGEYVYTFIIANIPLVLLSIMVKDKIKPVCWMMNVIMASIIFGSWAIYLVFLIWLIDTYILTYMKELYKDKYRIHKEIESRE